MMYRIGVVVLVGVICLSWVIKANFTARAAEQEARAAVRFEKEQTEQIRRVEERDRERNSDRFPRRSEREVERDEQERRGGERDRERQPARQRQTREDRRERAEPSQQHAEEITKRLAQLQDEVAELRGRDDAELRRGRLQLEIKKLEDQLAATGAARERRSDARLRRDQDLDRHREQDAFSESAEMERRIRHIYAAAEILEQASHLDLARDLHERAEKMKLAFQREMEEREQNARHDRDEPALDEVFAAIKQLRSEVRNLKREVDELKGLLKQQAQY